jgi:ABC-type sugar transport system permease subunit
LNAAQKRRAAPYVFLTPFALSFLVFTAYPVGRSLLLAFSITYGPRAQVFVGFDNFSFMFTDPDFYTAVRNTVVFTLGSVFVQLPVSLALALLLNEGYLRFRNLFRFAFFSPYLLGPVFSAVLFSVVFAPQYGLFNRGLDWLMPHALQAATGVNIETSWLDRGPLVMPALILTALWMYAGFNMVYFLAALQAVNRELYEAAEVDGANAWHRFWQVTIPGIRPVLVFVVVLSVIGSFQLFEIPWFILRTPPGPEKAGMTIVMYLYQRGFVRGDLGYASAVGWVLALGVLALSIAQLRLAGTDRPPKAETPRKRSRISAYPDVGAP